jgi:hypothetical protein
MGNVRSFGTNAAASSFILVAIAESPFNVLSHRVGIGTPDDDMIV